MGSNHGIVQTAKIPLGFGNALKNQIFTNAAVHPGVMGSWEEMWPYSTPLLAVPKAHICKYVRVRPMISGVIVKSWDKLLLEIKTLNHQIFLYLYIMHTSLPTPHYLSVYLYIITWYWIYLWINVPLYIKRFFHSSIRSRQITVHIYWLFKPIWWHEVFPYNPF